MMVGELSDVLGQDTPLDFRGSIGDLCGGVVVIDIDGKVALIHQNAREPFVQRSKSISPHRRTISQ